MSADRLMQALATELASTVRTRCIHVARVERRFEHRRVQVWQLVKIQTAKQAAMIAVLTIGNRLGRMPSVRGNTGDRLRASGVSGRHRVCVIVPGSSADRDAHAQRSRPHAEVNGGLELNRLSVQARGNRLAGGHV
jgi:hypothetical protein